MTCRDALLLLEFARPGATELEAPDINALETHLAECRSCTAFARQEREFNDRLVHMVDRIPQSSGGKSAVLKRLQSRSGLWHKQVALVSTIALLAGVNIWTALPRPKLDPDVLLTDAQTQFGNYDLCNNWLMGQNSMFQFPRGFDAKYLVCFQRQAIHGTNAPVLTFVRGDSLARVTVLSSVQFRNLSNYGNGQVFENSVATVLILRDATCSGVVYLVEIINGTVDRFYNEQVNTVT
jgi:hypothetical protein